MTKTPRRSGPPRAPRATRISTPRDSATVSTNDSAAETAAYIAQLTDELARIARGVRQEMLAYFLTMARLEAEAIARGNEPDRPG